jgi:hypothetical protein
LKIAHCLDNQLTDGGEVVSLTLQQCSTLRKHFSFLLMLIYLLESQCFCVPSALSYQSSSKCTCYQYLLLTAIRPIFGQNNSVYMGGIYAFNSSHVPREKCTQDNHSTFGAICPYCAQLALSSGGQPASVVSAGHERARSITLRCVALERGAHTLLVCAQHCACPGKRPRERLTLLLDISRDQATATSELQVVSR